MFSRMLKSLYNTSQVPHCTRAYMTACLRLPTRPTPGADDWQHNKRTSNISNSDLLRLHSYSYSLLVTTGPFCDHGQLTPQVHYSTQMQILALTATTKRLAKW
eukprot:GHUV01052352.1.p1 GENE.GHUV01052352.1~~GHUV01052352.1.p1  ORF type:complete len:103 (-),score=15.62 GHUV01052352.1:75-383(-)